MKTCVIIGKGPSFDAVAIRNYINPESVGKRRTVVLALNEAGWHVDCDAVVCADVRAAARLKAWCELKRIPMLLPSSVPFGVTERDVICQQIPGNRGWEGMVREECVLPAGETAFYTEGYSSTVAGWYSWLLGCGRIVTYGVGGRGYHPLFEGEPGNADQGGQATAILERLCEVKGIKLEIR